MRPERIVLIAVFFTLVLNPALCQKLFREGYVIKPNGDILNGLVEIKNGKNIPSECVFKRFEIAVQVNYKPGEIKEFGYRNGNRYKSVILDDKETFVEVVVDGVITLYKKGSRYLVEKSGTGITDVSGGRISYFDGSNIKEFNGLSSFLRYITADIPLSISEEADPRKDLIPAISEYNKKSGQDYIVYKKEYSGEMIYGKSIRAGTKLNSYGILGGVNNYLLTIKPSGNYYTPDPEPELTPVFGLFYERILSRVNTRTLLRAEMLFIKQTFYSYSESEGFGTQIYRDDAFFDFTGIRIPLLISHSLSSGNIKPYINEGIALTGFLSKKYIHIRETEIYSTEITTREDSDLKYLPGELTLLLGTGIKFKISGRLEADIQGRIELGHGLLYPGKEADKPKQYSVQPAFLVGISF